MSIKFMGDLLSDWYENYTGGFQKYINGLMQGCGNTTVLAMELLQSCPWPLIYFAPIYLLG